MPAYFRTEIDLSLRQLNGVISFYRRHCILEQFRERHFALIFRGNRGQYWLAVYDPIHVTRSYLGEPTRHGIRFKQLSDRYMQPIQERYSPYTTNVLTERGYFIYTHIRDIRQFRAYYVFDFQMEQNLSNIPIIPVQDVTTDLGNEDPEAHDEEGFYYVPGVPDAEDLENPFYELGTGWVL